MKNKNTPYNDYMSIVKTATKWMARAESKIQQRCLIEGCRYGLGFPGEIPQDKCIYCGQPRPDEYCLVKHSLKKHK